MKWPDFIIIGGHRCGTTQLFLDLNQHSEITMCRWTPITKETGYGGTEMAFWAKKNWDRGIEQYKKAFNGKICGEKTPTYWASSDSIKRMQEYIPDVKLILCIRNPVDRAYSHFHVLSKGRGDVNDYLRGGMYYQKIIKNILPYFDRSQLHIVVNEWMKKDPNDELRKVHEFLGASSLELPVERVAPDKGWIKGKTNLYDDSKKGKYTVWESGYSIPDAGSKSLRKHFKDHNEKLFKFLGYRIDEWEV